jgi:putative phosphonate metabolism protein
MTRYAIYFAPEPQSGLWRLGSSVVGYDAATGCDVPSPAVAGLSGARWAALTEEPRRYGFHGTLKAPFHLAEGRTEQDLTVDLARLAVGLAPIVLPPLVVASIGRFVALVPSGPCAALSELAAEVVTGLEANRATLGEADRARRLKSPLSERQVRYLDRYGYPYVLDEFRFHMTLTGPLDETDRGPVKDALAALFDGAGILDCTPVGIDALTLFRQERRDSRFRIVARMPLRDLRGG